MNRLVNSVLTILIMSAVCLSPAAAGEGAEVIVAPLESSIATPIGSGNPAAFTSCSVGNLNGASFALPSYIAPPEEFGLVFTPSDLCTACQSGANVNTVHVVLQTCEALVVEVSVALA